MSLTIRPIPAAQTRPLRGAMLRPLLPPEESVYPGDDAPDTLHVGAFVGGELVGVASLFHESPPGESDLGAWRLRGMAVSESAHRQGHGTALLKECFAHIVAHGGTRLWCNARTTALPFYHRLGFQAEGGEFLSPDTGPHFFMWRSMTGEG